MSDGRVTVAGIGPGSIDQMTARVRRALQESDVIAGYTVYVDLLREAFPEKIFFTTPMRGEGKRCAWALERAREGKRVCLVCSGDAGVYGLAGLVLELAAGQTEEPVAIEVLPGVTAATAGAALLGAPLVHDFCTVSLSDLLTPWETIENRLHAAAMAGFVIVLYNPASHTQGLAAKGL